jgi:hypothetical protein
MQMEEKGINSGKEKGVDAKGDIWDRIIWRFLCNHPTIRVRSDVSAWIYGL